MINWDKVNYFSPFEFPENTSFAEPQLFYNLGEYRSLIGRKIFPSPARGALARMTGSPSSQHYALGRLSTACDIFCEGTPIQNLISLIGSKLFNGIGIYLDTTGIDGKPWVMFHVDTRVLNDEPPVLWVVTKTNNKSNYYYPHDNPEYWSLLKHDLLYTDRIKSKGTANIDPNN